MTGAAIADSRCKNVDKTIRHIEIVSSSKVSIDSLQKLHVKRTHSALTNFLRFFILLRCFRLEEPIKPILVLGLSVSLKFNIYFIHYR